jgi:hypothetical protein
MVNNKWLLLAFVVLAVYLLPNIFFPNDAHFLIHDNLDSNVVWCKNLIESGTIYEVKIAIFFNILGGLPRGCHPPAFNFIIILVWLFPPLLAYNFNIMSLHCVAFFRMYVFTNSYILKIKIKLLHVAFTIIIMAQRITTIEYCRKLTK